MHQRVYSAVSRSLASVFGSWFPKVWAVGPTRAWRAAGSVPAMCGLHLLCAALWLGAPAPTWAQSAPSATSDSTPAGPIRLRQPGADVPAREPTDRRGNLVTQDGIAREAQRPVAKPSDFEQFVRRVAGQGPLEPDGIRRLGAELMMEGSPQESQDALPRVPADYFVSSGDELVVTIWGSVDADLRLVVDRSGQINIPRVGATLWF